MLKPGTPTVHVGMEAVKGPATIGLYHPGVGAGQVFTYILQMSEAAMVNH